MEKTKINFPQDGMKAWGIIAVIFSALSFYLLAEIALAGASEKFGIFVLNYLITLIYSVTFCVRAFITRTKIDHLVLMLLLWFISAFSLNLEFNIFHDSVAWLCVYICTTCAALVLALYKDNVSGKVRYMIFLLLGAGSVLFLYYAIYLFPLYVFSAPAALALGLSLHTFVPLSLFLVTMVLCVRAIRQYPSLLYAVSIGALFPIAACAFFVIHWHQVNRQIIDISNTNTLHEGKLPDWVLIAQHLSRDAVAERLIKAELTYNTVDKSASWWWGGLGGRAFDAPKQHDPLVVVASFFSGTTNIGQKERIKILESMYDLRHHAQERLWSGDQLETIGLTTNVRIFPEYRMAYTEKILSVRNNGGRGWNATQEAIYTFHLPEGAVVSSLSLWIDGREEKAYLTTKSKADSAYRQIVGVENRDPSVVHWQEGNQVSVRVFPCTYMENRKFKIGVSSPLRKQGDQLVYENVYFDGPTARHAEETVQLSFSQKPDGIPLDGYQEMVGGLYQLSRRYKPYWKLACIGPNLSKDSFSFDSSSYTIREYAPSYAGFDAENVYLDLNSSWSKQEFDEIWDKVKHKAVYAAEEHLVPMTAENKDELFGRLSRLNFSLFPLFRIADPEKALLISKSGAPSPNLRDLESSTFATKLMPYLSDGSPIRLYHIDSELSPYLRALKELDVFTYDAGSLAQLMHLMDEKRFVSRERDPNRVVIEPAGMLIEKAATAVPSKAPDHLLRLFAYNHIMKNIGSRYFEKDYILPELVAEAEMANIVSPVSSLIVLETQKDYERFGIDESKNSIKNASMKSSGAVPEPHEWAMILLTALIVLYMLSRPRQIKQSI